MIYNPMWQLQPWMQWNLHSGVHVCVKHMYYLFVFQIWNWIFGECKKNLQKADPKSSSVFGLYGRLKINMSLSFELRLVSCSWNSCNSLPVKDSQSLWSHFTGHREYNRKQREAIAAFSEVDSMEAPDSTSEGQEEEAYEGFAITLSYLVNVFLFIIKVQNLSLPSCVPWLIQAWRENTLQYHGVSIQMNIWFKCNLLFDRFLLLLRVVHCQLWPLHWIQCWICWQDPFFGSQNGQCSIRISTSIQLGQTICSQLALLSLLLSWPPLVWTSSCL